MRNIFLAMSIAILMIANIGAALSDASFIKPTPEIDLENYKEFYWAESVCPAIKINKIRTREQIVILGAAFGLTDGETLNKASIDAEKSMAAYQEDPSNYCKSVTKTFRSYDPEHLLRTGITEGL